VRTPCAAVGHGAHYHSQQNEAFFAHAPGLVLVCPRSCVQAKGLLLASMKNKNPVIFFEPKSLYRKLEEEVPINYYELDLFKAEVVREGTDLTMISYGAQYHIMEQAAHEYMSQHPNTSIELIDL
jgi:2-oxoisovalerate dehydrogenase E1 component beta subunit